MLVDMAAMRISWTALVPDLHDPTPFTAAKKSR